MTDLSTLIADLEKAKGPSRELDLAILRAVTGKPWRWVHYGQQEGVTWDEYGPGAIGNPVCSLEPHTFSLDAALTLVPEGWRAWFSWGCGYGDAGLMRPDDTPHLGRGWVRDQEMMSAVTTPLALCIACLWARLFALSEEKNT